MNEIGSHRVLFLLYFNIVLSWPEDGRSRPKHVAKYNLIVIIASCPDYVVYWRYIIYYTHDIHNGMASLKKKSSLQDPARCYASHFLPCHPVRVSNGFPIKILLPYRVSEFQGMCRARHKFIDFITLTKACNLIGLYSTWPSVQSHSQYSTLPSCYDVL